MADNNNLVFRWANNIRADGNTAASFLMYEKPNIPKALEAIGEIIGAAEAIMAATQEENA